jgi:hypothetical protein
MGLDFHLGRSQGRVVEHPGDAGACNGLAFDLNAAFDPEFHEIAHRKAYIRFEGLDARCLQAISHGRDFRRRVECQHRHGLTVEAALAGGLGRGHVQRPRSLHIPGANVELRQAAIVAHQEGSTRLQPTIEVNDGHARTRSAGKDSVAGLENESAHAAHRADAHSPHFSR